MDELIGVPEAARQLGVARNTVRMWCVKGLVRGAVQVGRNWVLPRAMLDDPPSRTDPRGRRRGQRVS